MRMEPWFKLYARFHRTVIDDVHDLNDAILGKRKDEGPQQDDHFADNLLRTEFVNEKPELLSRVQDKMFESYPVTSLKQIVFSPADKLKPSDPNQIENVFRTRFNVVTVQPMNLYEICQLFCPSCLKTVSFREGTAQCSDCDNGDKKQ